MADTHVNVNDLTITSIETITAFDVVTGNFRFVLDELQNASIAQTQETVEITGKQGRRLSTLKRNKAVTISGSNGMVNGGLLEVQTGGTFENKATEVMWTDYLTVGEENKVATNFKAIGTTGAEIIGLYLKNPDSTLGKALEQTAEEPSEGKFKYDPVSKELQFSEDVVAGTELVVYYKRKIMADVLTNESDVYSGKATLYIDAMAEDKCANVYRIQFYVPKADFSGEFTIEMGDNQTVHDFEAEALAGACGTGGWMWTYTVFGANTEDSVDP